MKRPDRVVARVNTEMPRVADVLFAQNGDPTIPGDVFERLRWGGTFIYASKKRGQAHKVQKQFHADEGFDIEMPISSIRAKPAHWFSSFFSRNHHYFVARKVRLIQPGRDTSRFTFDVQLVKKPNLADDYVVQKQVPSHESVVQRLVDRYPETDVKILSRRAAKLVDRIFPVFLTRETGMLEILHRRLPDQYKQRIPRVLGVRRDENRLVRKVYLNWLHPIARPLSQIEFAKQSADLLRVLHDTVGIIHLDLRLDNYVITEHGVGFVDFGSAVRVGEDITRSPMLLSLFEEMMSTSQIQKTLGKMAKAGKVTSSLFTNAYRKIDKTADLFYLTLQMTKPHSNPDFKDLIAYDKHSEQARQLARLARHTLRPADPDHPTVNTAAQLLEGIHWIELRLEEGLSEEEDEAGIPRSPIPTGNELLNSGSNY